MPNEKLYSCILSAKTNYFLQRFHFTNYIVGLYMHMLTYTNSYTYNCTCIGHVHVHNIGRGRACQLDKSYLLEDTASPLLIGYRFPFPRHQGIKVATYQQMNRSGNFLFSFSSASKMRSEHNHGIIDFIFIMSSAAAADLARNDITRCKVETYQQINRSGNFILFSFSSAPQMRSEHITMVLLILYSLRAPLLRQT